LDAVPVIHKNRIPLYPPAIALDEAIHRRLSFEGFGMPTAFHGRLPSFSNLAHSAHPGETTKR
jgi:hypothetical protein